jgi:hypothetical protein
MKINYRLLEVIREVRLNYWSDPTNEELNKKLSNQAISYTVYPN